MTAQPDACIIGGQPFIILERHEDGTVTVSRPRGLKTYRARRLDPAMDFLYGENRYATVQEVPK